MAGERKDARLKALSAKVEDFIQEHGAGMPRGYVEVTRIQRHLEISDAEWKELYLFMHNQRLVETDGRDAHMRLLPRPQGAENYVINVNGQNSRVNVRSTDNSVNSVSYSSNQIAALPEEFRKLREALLPQASEADHYSAIGAIASAETAAKEGDPSKIHRALSTLGTGAKWVLETAKDIGVQVAAETIVAAMKQS